MEKTGGDVKVKGECAVLSYMLTCVPGTDFVVKNVGKLRDHYRIGRKLGEGTLHH